MRLFLRVVSVLAFVSVSYGKGKVVKTTAPEAPTVKPKIVASSISLSVRQGSSSQASAAVANTASGAARSTTEHGVGVEVTVANLGMEPENVTVRWFWVGRYEKSANHFRTGDGEKTILVEPKKTQPPFAASGDIEGHDTKGATSQYKSGGHIIGWVVTAHSAKGDLIAVKVSDSYLEGFAVEPPPKQRR